METHITTLIAKCHISILKQFFSQSKLQVQHGRNLHTYYLQNTIIYVWKYNIYLSSDIINTEKNSEDNISVRSLSQLDDTHIDKRTNTFLTMIHKPVKEFYYSMLLKCLIILLYTSFVLLQHTSWTEY